MIKTAFLGTSSEALPALDFLAEHTDLVRVITRPDRPQGRGRALKPPPVKTRAVELGLTVAQPSSSAELGTLIAELPLDLGVVVGYGLLVKRDTLNRPRLGMVNLHFSLLPRWRGAAPIQRAILAGDRTTGVTLMQMEAGLDTGPALAVRENPIYDHEDAGALSDRLSLAAAELLADNIDAVANRRLNPIPQDESQVTWADPLTTAEARLDFDQPAELLDRTIRAFHPRPGAHTLWQGKRFKIRQADLASGRLEPGTLEPHPKGVMVGTATRSLLLRTVQPEGKKVMDALDWLRGIKGPLGCLGGSTLLG
ncbi:MAG: methionyl-tRNA formyltransferase [bacterium]|nr:methionyl-tRNA formyltransferase [bacterium]